MSNYPNIEAIANGTISGKLQEWSRVKPEAIAILEELKRLEGLILAAKDSEDPWGLESDALWAEVDRIRAQREEKK